MKRLVKEYVFDAGNQEITSPEFIGLATENLLLIVNTTMSEVVYNPLKSAIAGTLTGATLQLVTDTSSMNQTDELQIWIEDGVTPATNDNLDALVYLANCIAERMPMLDTLDRAQVTVANTVSVGQSGNWTLATLNALQNQPTAFAPYNWASGAFHIYQNVQVTP